MIRVGTCGGLQKDEKVGDLVISTGAVRLDGASKDYVMSEYPAIAHFEVVSALIAAAEALHVRYHVGVTASADTFYSGQGRPGYNDYFPSHKTIQSNRYIIMSTNLFRHIFPHGQRVVVRLLEKHIGFHCL